MTEKNLLKILTPKYGGKMFINFVYTFFRPSSNHPSELSEEKSSHKKALPSDLWQSPQFPKTPFWYPLVHQVNRPLDWLLERASNLACRRVQIFENYRKVITNIQFYQIHEWGTTVTVDSLAEMMSNRALDMPPSRLRAILNILQWTRDHVLARNQVCLDQLKHLDYRRIPVALATPRPTWLVDSVVAEHLDSARQWAEQADQGVFVVKDHNFGSLTNAQLDDLRVGLQIIELLFKTKQLEKACAATIKMYNQCKTLVKIAFVVPTGLMSILPKKVYWQVPLPFLGVACLVGAGFIFYQWIICEMEKIGPRVREAEKHCHELKRTLMDVIIARRVQASEVAEKKTAEAMREASEEAAKLRQQVNQLSDDVNQFKEEIEQIKSHYDKLVSKTENHINSSQNRGRDS